MEHLVGHRFSDYNVWKVSRKGVRVQLVVSLDGQNRCITAVDVSRNTIKEYALSDIAELERSAADERVLRLMFVAPTVVEGALRRRASAQHITTFEFSCRAHLEEFAMMIQMLDSHITIHSDGERALSATRTRFDVSFSAPKRKPCKRTLVVDTRHRVVERWKRTNKLMELVHTDQIRRRWMIASGPGPAEATIRLHGPASPAATIGFPSTNVREHFLGLVRQVYYQLPARATVGSLSASGAGGATSGGRGSGASGAGGAGEADSDVIPGLRPDVASGSVALDSSFAGRELKVLTATWNVGETNAPYPKSLTKLLPPREYDVYAIALQECNVIAEWGALIDAALGSTPIRLDATVTSSATSTEGGAGQTTAAADDDDDDGDVVTVVDEADLGLASPRASEWQSGAAAESATSDGEKPVGSAYRTIATVSLWNIHLIVVIRSDVVPHITAMSTGSKATGLGGVMGNKGGVGLSMTLDETTSVAFISSHLAARPGRVAQRNDNVRDICKGLQLGPSRDVDFVSANSHVFWMGDLNYRIDRGGLNIAHWGGLDHSSFLSNFSTEIAETRSASEGRGKSFTEYVIKVTSDGQEWVVNARFSKFYEMHKTLESFVGSATKLPRLPPKKMFGSLARGVVEKRKAQLQDYLEQTLRIPTVWRCREFVKFIDSPDGILEAQFADLWERTAAKEFNEVIELIHGEKWDELARSDQLNREMNSSHVFVGFNEGSIAFPPTYRMNKDAGGYSNKRNQNPSYTDRILYRSRPGYRSDVVLKFYNSVMALKQSDHRPVHAAFSLRTRLPYVILPDATAEDDSALAASVTVRPTVRIMFRNLEYRSSGAEVEELSLLEDAMEDDNASATSDEGGTVVTAAGAAAPEASPRKDTSGDPAAANSVCVEFVCGFAVSQKTGYVGLQADGSARFDVSSTPSLSSWVGDVRWVRRQQVQLVVRNARGQVIGAADVALDGAFVRKEAEDLARRVSSTVIPEAAADVCQLLALTSAGNSFAVRLLRNGLPVGLLRGQVMMSVLEPLSHRLQLLRKLRRKLVAAGRGRKQSSRSFLEAFAVGIPTTEHRVDSKGEYIVYNVRVTSGITWTVSHRYTSFSRLHKIINDQLPREDLPEMAGKHRFGVSHLKSTFVEKRRRELEAYMKELCSIPAAWRCLELWEFLDNDSSTLTAQVMLHRILDHTRQATILEDPKAAFRQGIRAVIALNKFGRGKKSHADGDPPAGATDRSSEKEITSRMMSEFIGTAEEAVDGGDGDTSSEYWEESSDDDEDVEVVEANSDTRAPEPESAAPGRSSPAAQPTTFIEYWKSSQFKRDPDVVYDCRDQESMAFARTVPPDHAYAFARSRAERLGFETDDEPLVADAGPGYSARFSYGAHGVGAHAETETNRYSTGVFRVDGTFVGGHLDMARPPSANPHFVHLPAQQRRTSLVQASAAGGANLHTAFVATMSPPAFDATRAARAANVGTAQDPVVPTPVPVSEAAQATELSEDEVGLRDDGRSNSVASEDSDGGLHISGAITVSTDGGDSTPRAASLHREYSRDTDSTVYVEGVSYDGGSGDESLSPPGPRAASPSRRTSDKTSIALSLLEKTKPPLPESVRGNALDTPMRGAPGSEIKKVQSFTTALMGADVDDGDVGNLLGATARANRRTGGGNAPMARGRAPRAVGTTPTTDSEAAPDGSATRTLAGENSRSFLLQKLGGPDRADQNAPANVARPAPAAGAALSASQGAETGLEVKTPAAPSTAAMRDPTPTSPVKVEGKTAADIRAVLERSRKLLASRRKSRGTT